MTADHQIKLTLAYDGSEFSGFQKQENAPTVQSALEEALQRVNGETVTAHGAGRTDSGVHALGQVACFVPRVSVPLQRWPKALNRVLTPSLVVRSAERVCPEFDPVRWARYKHYRYHIETSGDVWPFLRNYVYHCRWDDLDVEAMRRAARLLLGKSDFASFQVSGRPVSSTIRTMYQLGLKNDCGRIKVDMIADGFLYKMARSIIGTLIEVGRGAMTAEEFGRAAAAGDRAAAGPTAPGEGLYLIRVQY